VVIDMELVVDNVALWDIFLRPLRVSPVNCHSINDPYSSVIKGWYSRPFVTSVLRDPN
jgi:hypothetical protein